MTNLKDDFWSVRELTSEELILVEVYQRSGRSVDDLPYTDEFEQICKELKASDPIEKHQLFRKLLSLRKQGLLPNVYRSQRHVARSRSEAQETE